MSLPTAKEIEVLQETQTAPGREYSGKRYWTPPLWMRHIIPWFVLRWLDDRLDTCWTGIVMWKLGYDWVSGWNVCAGSCFNLDAGHELNQYDYCGKFNVPEEYRYKVTP